MIVCVKYLFSGKMAYYFKNIGTIELSLSEEKIIAYNNKKIYKK